MVIKINISKALILEGAKAETYLKGKFIESSSDSTKASSAEYNAIAGDDTTHERKLERSYREGIERIKTILVDYLDNEPNTVGDNNISTEEGEITTLFFKVAKSWQGSLTDALARFVSKYIEDLICAEWYGALSDQQTQYYNALLVIDEKNIRKCFIYSAYTFPTSPYSSTIKLTLPNDMIDISGETDTDEMGTIASGQINMVEGDKETVTFTLDDGAIDDIECRSENPSIVKTRRTRYGFDLVAGNKGFTYVTLFSRHKDTCRASIRIVIQEKNTVL